MSALRSVKPGDEVQVSIVVPLAEYGALLALADAVREMDRKAATIEATRWSIRIRLGALDAARALVRHFDTVRGAR
jgi:hypothetical protein